jgi:hypothetical protein
MYDYLITATHVPPEQPSAQFHKSVYYRRATSGDYRLETSAWKYLKSYPRANCDKSILSGLRLVMSHFERQHKIDNGLSFLMPKPLATSQMSYYLLCVIESSIPHILPHIMICYVNNLVQNQRSFKLCILFTVQ